MRTTWACNFDWTATLTLDRYMLRGNWKTACDWPRKTWIAKPLGAITSASVSTLAATKQLVTDAALLSDNSLGWRRRRIGLVLAYAMILLASSNAKLGQAFQDEQTDFPVPTNADNAVEPATASVEKAEVTIGFNGVWKIGHVCPIGIQVPADQRSALQTISIETIDGDGVSVVYQQAVEGALDSADNRVWVPIRIGGNMERITIRLNAVDRNLSEISIDPFTDAQPFPSTQSLVLALGSSMGVEELTRTSLNGDKTFTTAVVASADLLPRDYRDYSACDLIVISTRDLNFLQSISVEQWTAIDAWIRYGGGCIISLGGSAERLGELPGLTSLLPGRITGEATITNPAGLESLMATDEPIRAFPAVVLEMDDPLVEIELALPDALSRRVPWWTSYPHGHGTIRLIASDLDHESLRVWKDRRSLWERLLDPYVTKEVLEGNSAETAVGTASYLGYDDMVGQLRATLDVFSTVRVVSFGQVAGLLISFLLLIGPLDYLICVIWLKRPELSWLVAATMLAAVSTGLVFLYQKIRPAEVLVNTAQIIDVDSTSGRLRGRLWSHVYSGDAQKLNIAAKRDGVFLDWQGLPGRGLGGLQSQIQIDRGMPKYRIEIEPNGGSWIVGVGISSAGTKCLVGDWLEQIDVPESSNLREMSGVDQLEGELVNPLPVDLNEPILFYHNWYYVLNSRITAGEHVPISADTIPKPLSRRLNRQRTIGREVDSSRWDPSERNELDRLLELMMFFEAASGRSYTSLTHRYQPHIDQSNLLDTDLAILIGSVERAPVELSVMQQPTTNSVDTRPAELGELGINRTWYRISIPVGRPIKK